MATKSSKAGDKRKAVEVPEKKVKKSEGRKEGPDSTRKLFRNEDASDDSDDDLSDGEDGGAELPVKKKSKHAKDSAKSESSGVTDKKQHERGQSWISALT